MNCLSKACFEGSLRNYRQRIGLPGYCLPWATLASRLMAFSNLVMGGKKKHMARLCDYIRSFYGGLKKCLSYRVPGNPGNNQKDAMRTRQTQEGEGGLSLTALMYDAPPGIAYRSVHRCPGDPVGSSILVFSSELFKITCYGTSWRIQGVLIILLREVATAFLSGAIHLFPRRRLDRCIIRSQHFFGIMSGLQ